MSASNETFKVIQQDNVLSTADAASNVAINPEETHICKNAVVLLVVCKCSVAIRNTHCASFTGCSLVYVHALMEFGYILCSTNVLYYIGFAETESV